MKKALIGLAAFGTALALVPMFAAFEAHVVNVTAKIENALAVSTEAIDFGTVFPQEHLNQPLVVQLSGSFLEEERVDDVEYFIRQKPKCGWTNEDGTNLYGLPTATGHVFPGEFDQQDLDPGEVATQFDGYHVICPNPGNPLRPAGAVWDVLPSLCPYISKEGEDDNDGTTPSFHEPWTIHPEDGVIYLDTHGRLAKSEQDQVDNWIIDLAVPCFGNHCAQDWASFVNSINPDADPDDYTQDIANEHKVFGCDLWVEVSGVSTSTQPVENPS